jgi:hypothetical protein
LARVKAIFDADILIHLVETDSIKFALGTLDCIYVSEYVYQHEIRKGTEAEKLIKKLINKKQLKILTYKGLTAQQKRIYGETYKLLERETISDDPEKNPINKGERVTAAFAKASNIYYYMSDDNKAAPYIRSLVEVEVVNFCDILFLYLRIFGKDDIEELRISYKSFIDSYGDRNNIPKILKVKDRVLPFEEMMGRCYDKFDNNINLKRLISNIEANI